MSASAACEVDGQPHIDSFAMSPATIEAPAVGATASSTLSALVDLCGTEGLTLQVDTTSPAAETSQVVDFGQTVADDGTRSSALTWESSDVGTWSFTLTAAGTDAGGAVRTATSTTSFTITQPAPPPPLPTVTVPSAPRSLSVSRRTASGGTITWAAPSSDGGGSITGYLLSVDGSQRTLSAATTSYAIGGLRAGSSFEVSVQAVNIAGTGAAASTTLKTLATVPTAPRGLDVAKLTSTSARITWTAPASTGGAKVTGYRIVKPGADVTVKATARSYTVKGLKPGRTYSISVKAKNAEGYGPSQSLRVTTPATKPGKPRSLKVSARTRTSGKVSWKAPSSNGGASITGYRIVKPGADVTVGAGSRSYTVRGLKAGRSYTIKVQAENARGYGKTVSVKLTTKKAPKKNCTPGYSPCLPPASDYDCAGGGGNGPKFVYVTVRVTGPDPYDLDRDGDGYGCD